MQEAQAILRRGRNFIVEIIPNRLPYYNCVDSFGRYRRETEAARAQLLGTVDAQQTVIMTLVGDVASDYFLLRDLDLQLQITQQTARDQQESVKLSELRLQHGVGTTLDVLQARHALDTANAQIQDLAQQIGQTEDAINILLGQYRVRSSLAWRF